VSQTGERDLLVVKLDRQPHIRKVALDAEDLQLRASRERRAGGHTATVPTRDLLVLLKFLRRALVVVVRVRDRDAVPFRRAAAASIRISSSFRIQ
jgi:hypothetical protein